VIEGAAQAALVMLGLAIACCVVRLALGPELGDRVVAMDTLVLVLINIVVTAGVLMRTRTVLDVPVVLAALAFVGTVAAARFMKGGAPFA
jgi:multisubunit Na+/H+ antiporter MnhF subunit